MTRRLGARLQLHRLDGIEPVSFGRAPAASCPNERRNQNISGLKVQTTALDAGDREADQLFDGSGLYLLVQPSGGRWWRFNIASRGKSASCHWACIPRSR